MIDNVKASLKTEKDQLVHWGLQKIYLVFNTFSFWRKMIWMDFTPVGWKRNRPTLLWVKITATGVRWREGKVEEFCGSHGFQWRGGGGGGGNREKRESVIVVVLSDRKIVTVLIYNKKLSFKKSSDITRTESQGTELVWHSNFWHFKQLGWNYFKYRNFWRPVVSFIYHGYKVTFIKSASEPVRHSVPNNMANS